MSELSDFLKFTVNLDEIPISTDSKIMKDDSVTKLSEITSGKNVVINWEFLDNFNTNGELWFDANGLQMVHKDLWQRYEFEFSNNSKVAGNYYPIQSAIAVRDKNSHK